VLPGRETTSDTLLLADAASSINFKTCFDLGTGTGEVLRNTQVKGGFRVGLDLSPEALALFDRRFGQPVLCPVERVYRTFRRGCADLVLANPPYNVRGKGRISPDRLRRQARTGDPLTVHRFVFAAAFLLRPGGTLVITAPQAGLQNLETAVRAAGFTGVAVIGAWGAHGISAVMGDTAVP
jgi:tRNA1(Val) A37 N6-methylase TrmN6